MAAHRPFIHVITALAVVSLAACGGGDAKPAANTASAAGSAAGAPAATPASGTAGTATQANAMGQQVYATCTTCHMANGQGVAATYPPLAGSEIATGTPEIPIAIVLHGLTGPLEVHGQKYNNVMTPWGPVFNDEQIAAVLTYVRSQWGNNASAITAAQVAKVRAATSSRTTMWTWKELQAFKF